MNFEYIYLDFETRSHSDLKAVGTFNYSKDPFTEIICVGWLAKDMKEARSVSFDSIRKKGLPASLAHHLQRASGGGNVCIVAHNSFFDFCIYDNIGCDRFRLFPKISYASWLCSASLCSFFNVPRGLDRASKFFNLKNSKLSDGKELIKLFSHPILDKKTKSLSFREMKQADIKAFESYCKRDVDTTKELWLTLESRLKKAKAFKIYFDGLYLDKEINCFGSYIDVKLAERMNAVFLRFCELELSRTKAKYEINISSHVQVKKYAESVKEPLESCNKDFLSTIIKDIKDAGLKDIIETRLAINKATPKKLPSLLSRVSDENRLYDSFIAFGARTGRWKSAGVQLQNFSRPLLGRPPEDLIKEVEKIDISSPVLPKTTGQVIADLMPSVITAPEGNALIKCDLNAIEARIAFWLAGETKTVDAYSKGVDIYKDFASSVFKKPVSEINKKERYVAKQAVLGCLYRMGHVRFRELLRVSHKVILSESEAIKIVNSFRSYFRKIESAWRDLDQVLRYISSTSVKHLVAFGKIKIHRFGFDSKNKGSAFVFLPSGRPVLYFNFAVKYGRLSYVNFDRGAMPVDIHGGLFFENIVQAIAFDVFAFCVKRLMMSYPKWRLSFTVHDEAVFEVPKACIDQMPKAMKEFCHPIRWAMGLPLAVEYSCVKRYHKL